MNTITKAERAHILARAMEIVTLDADAMIENPSWAEAQIADEFKISYDRARRAVYKAARIKRHPKNFGETAVVTLRMEVSILAAIDRANPNRSEFIRQAILEKLNQNH